METPRALTWIGVDELTIGDTGFRVGRRPTAADETPDGRFRLKRDRHAIEQIAELVVGLQPRNIVELGIFQGAGTAFFAELAQPQKLVALDVRTTPMDRLAPWVEARGLREVIRTYYGVDQADDAAVRRIVADEFAAQPVDLVVDDASYYLEAKRASFNALFPYLRPGGIYLIDHWSRDHKFEAAAAADHAAREQILDAIGDESRTAPPPTTVLLFELVLACAYSLELIEEIMIHDQWSAVVRGKRPLDPGDFDVSTCYGKGGRRLINGL